MNVELAIVIGLLLVVAGIVGFLRDRLAVAIRNRLAVCALALMLAPYGLSVPTFAKAVQAKPADDVVYVVQMKPADDADLHVTFMEFADARTAGYEKLGDQHADGYMPSLHMGGTIFLSQPVTHVDPSRMIR